MLLQLTLLQLSLPVAPPFDASQAVTALLADPEQFNVRLLAPLVIVGGVVSTILMLAFVVEAFPHPSVAVNTTHTEPLQPVGAWPL